jgi:hypothetical protein
MREVPSWNVQSPWSGASSEKKLRIRSLVAIPQAQTFVFGFNVLNGLDLEVDAEIVQGVLGDGQSLVPERALKIVFRE